VSSPLAPLQLVKTPTPQDVAALRNAYTKVLREDPATPTDYEVFLVFMLYHALHLRDSSLYPSTPGSEAAAREVVASMRQVFPIAARLGFTGTFRDYLEARVIDETNEWKAAHEPLPCAPDDASTAYRNQFQEQLRRGFKGDYIHFLEALIFRAYQLYGNPDNG
jgi:hypothetical protein